MQQVINLLEGPRRGLLFIGRWAKTLHPMPMVAETSIIEGPRFETAPPSPERQSLLLPIILSLTAVVFLVGGFILFDSPPTRTPAASLSAEESTSSNVVKTQTPTRGDSAVVETKTAATVSVVEPSVKASTVRVSVASMPTGSFVLEAQAGDGVTHLARRAVTRYLTEEGLVGIFSPEQRIYMEDFVKDHVTITTLTLGEELLIDETLLQEAAIEAQALTEAELVNLEQYVALVPSLTQ